jgi:hypothetical protein
MADVLARNLLDAGQSGADAGEPGYGFGIGAGTSRAGDSGMKCIIRDFCHTTVNVK